MSKRSLFLSASAMAVAVTLTGCSTGFNRGRLESELHNGSYEVSVEHAPRHVTATDINRAREKRGQLHFPFRLAVQMIDNRYEKGFRWNQADKDLINGWEKTLRDRGVVSDIILINDSTNRGDSPEQVRLAAAEHGADAVLVLRAASDIDEYANPLSILYLTILGLWMAPGSHIDALVMLDGSVLDVGNGFLYASAQSEGEGSSFGPKALIERKDAIDEAETIALKGFGDALTEELTGLK